MFPIFSYLFARPRLGRCVGILLLTISLVFLGAGAGRCRDGLAPSGHLRLGGEVFDPLAGVPPARRGAGGQDLACQDAYALVQFDGPVTRAAIATLRSRGLEVLDYVPDNALIVKMPGRAGADLGQAAGVRWIGPYRAAWRLAPRLRLRPGSLRGRAAKDTPPGPGPAGPKRRLAWDRAAAGDPVDIVVSLFPGENPISVATGLEDLGGVVDGVSAGHPRALLRARLPGSALAAAAFLPGVRWIEPAPRHEVCTDRATVVAGVREVWSPYGLTGRGQVVAVCDTGLDRGFAEPGLVHADFLDADGGSRVLALLDLVGDGADDVRSGHGTHVAGCVLGSGTLSGALPQLAYYPEESYAGVAPEAGLVFQAVEDNSTGLLSGIPVDLRDLFTQAAAQGACVHSGSWGAPVEGAYTLDAENTDAYVWEHPEAVVLFAAGNYGVDEDADGVVDPGSLAAPATAKNCIAVGAGENDRLPGSGAVPGLDRSYGEIWPYDFPADPVAADHVSDNPAGMAAFSSRGPTRDGRYKPDLVAPGTNIISTRSSAAWGTGWGVVDDHYLFMGGTSQACPLAAGAAALVRDYYVARRGFEPSAALVKATLIHGAQNTAPGQYGTGPVLEIPEARPNNVSGWGRIHVGASLFPTPPRRWAYHDAAPGLETGESAVFPLRVESPEPLTVILAWSDYPGTPAADGGLVNDLDLALLDPAGRTHYPNNPAQPKAQELLSCDDGEPDGGYYINDAAVTGFQAAVRLTPSMYPARLERAYFYLAAQVFPQDVRWHVYTGDAVRGPLGLTASGTLYVGGEDLYAVDLGAYGLEITQDDFFVAVEIPPGNVAWAFDGSPPIDGRSWDYYDGAWSRWAEEDYFFRALVSYPEDTEPTSYDRANNIVGIELPAPMSGMYTVQVGAYNVPFGPQPYALAVSGGLAAEGDLVNAVPCLTLVQHYYQAILDREAEPGGAEAWRDEITRTMGLGIDVQEGFIALAMNFFHSREYQDRHTTDSGYVTDLYETFLERMPSAGEVDTWTGELAAGLSRSALLTFFAYCDEFRVYMEDLFGTAATRPENNLVNDFYRGLLHRLPDPGGFEGWRDQVRTAQCTGAQAVRDVACAEANAFFGSGEYDEGSKSEAVFVEDLYNAFLRRGADAAGFNYWVSQLSGGHQTRLGLLGQFVDSVEFQERVTEVTDAGCLPGQAR